MRVMITCALLLVSAGPSLAAEAGAGLLGKHLHRHHRLVRVRAALSSEASVPQATGLIKLNGAKLGLLPTEAGRPTKSAPATCTTQNSSSPQCYTATQQTRSR